MKRAAAAALRFVPLTAARWPDFVRLFGPRGACGGCWCMTPRLTAREFAANVARDRGASNRTAMRRRVGRGPAAPGLLAMRGDEPVAWIAIAPRTEFRRLATSRVLKPVDAAPVWSIACLFLRKDVRRQGLSAQLIDAAAEFAFAHGAEIVEGYPQIPQKAEMPAVFAWTGMASAFAKAGFVEVARRAPTRPIMRRARV